MSSRLPDLKAFIKGGEAETYRNIQIQYVRGQQTVLHVFRNDSSNNNNRAARNQRDTDAIDRIVLSAVSRKEDMHRLLQEAGFERKSAAELEADAAQANAARRQRNLSMFHRSEYVRLQHLHAHLFRRDVVYKTEQPKTYVQDYLHTNYDKIFKALARTKADVRLYATRYLATWSPPVHRF
jgi:acetoin utilization deacetylase AcuC-like enzyme